MSQRSNRPKRRTPEAQLISKDRLFAEYLNRLDQAKAYELPESLRPYHPDHTLPPKWFQEAFANVRESYLQAPDMRKPGRWQHRCITMDMVDWFVSIHPDTLKIEIARAFEYYMLPIPEPLEAAKNDLGEDVVGTVVNAYAKNLEMCMRHAPDLFLNLLAAKLNNLTVEIAHEVALITLRDVGDKLLSVRPFDFNAEVTAHEQLLLAMLRDRLGVPLSGRPIKTDAQRKQEARAKKKKLLAMSRAIDEIIEEWPKKSKALMTVEILCRELAKKGHTMGPRTLNERLKDMGRSIISIRAEIEKNLAT